MIDTNVYQVGTLLHKFMNKFQQRKKRSGIICVGSFAGQFVIPYEVMFGMVKVFVKQLCMSTAMEVSKFKSADIDIECVLPVVFDSKAATENYKPAALEYFKSCVRNSLKHHGSEVTTYGGIVHDVVCSMFTTIFKYLPAPS